MALRLIQAPVFKTSAANNLRKKVTTSRQVISKIRPKFSFHRTKIAKVMESGGKTKLNLMKHLKDPDSAKPGLTVVLTVKLMKERANRAMYLVKEDKNTKK